MTTQLTVPTGYRLFHYKEIDSTNSEALRRAKEGDSERLWIVADYQTAGRGRGGRSWQSEQGNLYASLALRLKCPLETALQLSFLAGVAVFDAVKAAAPNPARLGTLGLKWPNDLMLARHKLGGILLESVSGAKGTLTVIIGTGLNLVSHPELSGRSITHLNAHDVVVHRDAAFKQLALMTNRWLEIWDEGMGFAAVRSAWLARAAGLGEPVRVHVGGEEEEGVFSGIDEKGALILTNHGGNKKLISVGDVYLS